MNSDEISLEPLSPPSLQAISVEGVSAAVSLHVISGRDLLKGGGDVTVM